MPFLPITLNLGESTVISGLSTLLPYKQMLGNHWHGTRISTPTQTGLLWCSEQSEVGILSVSIFGELLEIITVGI